MKLVKTNTYLYLLSCFVSLACLLSSQDAAAADIEWRKYMQSAANVSAIAAAVAMVDGCSKKLLIDETVSDTTVRLSFLCTGSEDEEAAAFIEFHKIGDDTLLPGKFEFAG